MQELRLVLIIVGALIIAALLFHGLWTSRKEKPAKFGDKPLGKIEDAQLDNQGKAEERIIDTPVTTAPVVDKTKAVKRQEPEFSFGERPSQDPLLGETAKKVELPTMTAVEQETVTPEPMAPQSQVATPSHAPVNVEPQPVADVVVAPVTPAPQVADVTQQTVADSLVTEATVDVNVEENVTEKHGDTQSQAVETVETVVNAQPIVTETVAAETVTPVVEPQPVQSIVVETPKTSVPQFTPVIEEVNEVKGVEAKIEAEADVTVVEENNRASVQAEVAKEPVKVRKEPSFSFMPEPELEPAVEPEPEPELEPVPLEPSYISLCVHARKGRILRGPSLFACLERHNLVFGDNSVFHCHADAAGTGPVVFSVTNLVNPGSFPETNYQHFETPGIGFYLMLPCHGKASSNFNKMLQTAQQIADELNADVLDHDRIMITPNRIAEYRDKAVKYNAA